MLDNRNVSGTGVAFMDDVLSGRVFSLATEGSVALLSGKKARRVFVCLDSCLSEFLTYGRLRCRSNRNDYALFALWSAVRYLDHLNRSLEATARAS